MMSLTYHASREALVPFLEKSIWSEGVGEEEIDYSDVEVVAFLVGSSNALEVASAA